MTLLDRAIKAHGTTTEKGKVADHLPLSAVYGLLCALEHHSTDGIRPEDQKAILAHFGNTKKLVANMNAGDKVLMDENLMTAGRVSAGYGNGRVERYGFLTLTERGERWAKRLKAISNDGVWINCKGCDTLHRDDTLCPE